MRIDQSAVVPDEDPARSVRQFGYLLATVAALLAFWALLRERTGGGAPAAALVALALLAVTRWRTRWLERPHRLWMGLGMLLGRIVSPIVLAILFFGVITSVALVQRLAGRDELRLRMRRGASSHWQPREPAGPPSDSFDHQY